jgi:hypothetical protein
VAAEAWEHITDTGIPFDERRPSMQLRRNANARVGQIEALQGVLS